MVTFARVKAKSLVSKIWLIAISKTPITTNEKVKSEELSIQKEKSSNHFLEAIKKGGIWLS